MADSELLDERIMSQTGRVQRIRRWWRGVHPDRGTIVRGHTGWETMEERDRIVPHCVIGVASHNA